MARLDALLDQADPAHDNLFAYPAQSSFSGVKHPFDLVSRAQAKGWDGFCDQTRLTIGDVTCDIESCRIIRDRS